MSEVCWFSWLTLCKYFNLEDITTNNIYIIMIVLDKILSHLGQLIKIVVASFMFMVT